MVSNVIDPSQKNQTESVPRSLLLIEDAEQKESLHHPVRKRILRVLSTGINDYETEVITDVQTLEDGTGLTHSVEVRRPIKRYWMVVPEIVERLGQRYPDFEITSYQCYYHLQKLEEQGLVEQNPPPEFDDSGKKKRTRGLQFCSAARFFLYHSIRFSEGDSDTCLEFLQSGLGLEPSDDDCEQLIQLISEQDKTLFRTFEHLVGHMDESVVDNMSFSVLLDRLAHVLLSDNDKFIERYRDAKRILVRSGGRYLDSGGTMSNSIDDVKNEKSRGKDNE